MTLNFRSASYLSAGNSGSTALTVCAGGLLQLLSNPHSSQGQVSSQHGVLQAQNQLQTFHWGSRGLICQDLLVTVLTQCWLLSLLLPLTGPAPLNPSLRPVRAFKNNWQLWAQTEEPEGTFFLEKEPFFLERASSENRSWSFTCPVHLLVSTGTCQHLPFSYWHPKEGRWI